MEKHNMDKLNQLMKWAERVRMLENAAGKDVNEMLGQYASAWLNCDKCPIHATCREIVPDSCGRFWNDYLEGKY